MIFFLVELLEEGYIKILWMIIGILFKIILQVMEYTIIDITVTHVTITFPQEIHMKYKDYLKLYIMSLKTNNNCLKLKKRIKKAWFLRSKNISFKF